MFLMDSEWLKSQFAANPGKTKSGLAKMLGLEPPAISKILAGQRQIKAAEYMTMRKFFGLPVDSDSPLDNSYVLEPLGRGMAEKKRGDKGGSTESPWIMPAQLFESRTKAPPEKIKIFEVQENAMVPDLMQGETVLVDMSDQTPSPPGVFVVSDGMGHIVRQCEYVPHSDPPQIRLSSRNASYESYVMPLDKAAIIGRVIAKLQWL